nr:hypothetical protein [Nocardiopsis sp. ATB16-24]
MAPPSDPHHYIAARVSRMLGRVLPDEWDVCRTLGIQLVAVERLYVPDLVVMPEDIALDPSNPPARRTRPHSWSRSCRGAAGTPIGRRSCGVTRTYRFRSTC